MMLKFLKMIFASVPSIDVDTYMQEYQGKNNHVLIDVRTPNEFKSGHVAKAKNIPMNTIGNKMSSIPKDKTVILICRTGNRSGIAAKQLAGAGYENVINLKGGVMRWQAEGHSLK